jgi:hypothetical protein
MHANVMGEFVGAVNKYEKGDAVCPGCLGRMAQGSSLCVACSNQRLTDKRWNSEERAAARRDRHRRFEAAVQAGWSVRLLMATLCALPTWCEICARDPFSAIKYRPDVVIQMWWGRVQQYRGECEQWDSM